MKIHRIYFHKKPPKSGIRISADTNLALRDPHALKYIIQTARRIKDKRKIYFSYDELEDVMIIIRPKNRGIKAFSERLKLKYEALFSEAYGRPDFMPQNAQTLRFPVTLNGIRNAFAKVLKGE